MIPKIIHYCWFGSNPLSELAKKCIASWKKFCPDYEIKGWNESNFDLHICPYVQEAYEARKWAFVSDYARFWILYHEGGLYFDTDVELIKPIDDIVDNGPFMGCEKIDCVAPELGFAANPGLGLAANSGLGLYKEILDFYSERRFIRPDGTLDVTTVVTYVSNILAEHEWKPINETQNIEGITVYQKEYFCPMDYETGVITITDQTRSIHHYTASWTTKEDRFYHQISQNLQRLFGKSIGKKLGRIIDFPHRVNVKVKQKGIMGTIMFAINKLK